MENKRCPWAQGDLYIDYHDQEWGRPLHDDSRLFELLILEGMQAGLSWITILKKREAFREAFDFFDPAKVASYSLEKQQELMNNAGIIRNQRKISASVSNAQAFLKLVEQYGSFDQYLWAFVDGKPIVNHWEDVSQIPATSDISDKLSKDLKSRGFRFVGSTICYSFMQSAGLVNDHMIWCDQFAECSS